jgi:hypothetical protein
MYYATGLPGWMRFGYSPGWVDRSATGLGPCAEYMTTGQWPTPQMAAAWQGGPAAGGAWPWGYPNAPPVSMPADQEVQMLRSHADALKTQLDQISARLEELEQTEP